MLSLQGGHQVAQISKTITRLTAGSADSPMTMGSPFTNVRPLIAGHCWPTTILVCGTIELSKMLYLDKPIERKQLAKLQDTLLELNAQCAVWQLARQGQ